MAGGSTSLRDALLPAVDTLRGIPNQLGLRLFAVTVYSRTWSGSRPGVGTPVHVELPIKVSGGSGQVRVRQLSQRDVIASGGALEDVDYAVGPITPPYIGSAQDDDQISVFNPPVQIPPLDIVFRITGPGMGTTGVFCKKIGQDVTQNFRYMLRLRRTGENF